MSIWTDIAAHIIDVQTLEIFHCSIIISDRDDRAAYKLFYLRRVYCIRSSKSAMILSRQTSILVLASNTSHIETLAIACCIRTFKA
jgi:hypothetical protein